MRLNSGVVYIDNEIIGKQKQFPDSMGILIEYPSFIPGYTGFQNLKFLSSINNKISDEEIYNIIQRVGLDKTDKRKYKKILFRYETTFRDSASFNGTTKITVIRRAN